MKTTASTLICALMLSGCAGIYGAGVNEMVRQSTVEAFPDPADRQGLDHVFKFNPDNDAPTIWVVHIKDQVSNAEVLRRVMGYCTRLDTPGLTGGATIREVRDENAVVTLDDGTTTAGFDALYECTES